MTNEMDSLENRQRAVRILQEAELTAAYVALRDLGIARVTARVTGVDTAILKDEDTAREAVERCFIAMKQMSSDAVRRCFMAMNKGK